MKRIICLLAAVSVTTAACTTMAAFAADKENGEPDVYVDGSRIIFEDQDPIIKDERTLVPARGVFEAMGCTVDWDGDTRTVKVTGSGGDRYVIITIDSDIMKICTSREALTVDGVDYTLDVPAQIMNDRTMIPLRAVSEAFDCNVEWDNDNYRVVITTGAPKPEEDAKPAATATPKPIEDAKPTAAATQKPATSGGSGSGAAATQKPATSGSMDDGDSSGSEETDVVEADDTRASMSLSTDHEGSIEAGEEFTVYIDAYQFPGNAEYVSAVAATFEYDKTRFEYVAGSGTMLADDDAPFEAPTSTENTELEIGTKVMFVNTLEGYPTRTKPGHVFKATFRSLTGESGTITLNNDYSSHIGYGSYLMFYLPSEDEDFVVSGDDLDLAGGTVSIGQ